MNLNNYKPAVLVVSTSGTIPVALLKLITRTCDVKEDNPHKLSQTWNIDTKYYTADVDIHGITEHYHRSDAFNDAVKALIIYMDGNAEAGPKDLSKWEVLENECELEIKLLISEYHNDDTNITHWCLKHGFEFIVMNPDVENDQEEEIIKEKFGVDRIIEALQTYVWPNLEMKRFENVNKNKQESKSLSGEQSNDMLDDMFDYEGMDDFTELFGQLHLMKESIQSMPSNERKQCAEQMVTAFWKAIGGDEDDLEDL